MPLEIKELVIRATVDDGGGAAGGEVEAGKDKPADRAAMVTECVEQVLQILRRERER
jgi:hypothetical protein